jgi:hypothetical protein
MVQKHHIGNALRQPARAEKSDGVRVMAVLSGAEDISAQPTAGRPKAGRPEAARVAQDGNAD